MDSLVTVIGNAAVDPIFRKRFLDNPIEISDQYHFHLTKGEFELMHRVFVDLEPKQRADLEDAFLALQTKLYTLLETTEEEPQHCHAPCAWSIYPPRELRAKVPKLEKVTPMTKRTGTNK